MLYRDRISEVERNEVDHFGRITQVERTEIELGRTRRVEISYPFSRIVTSTSQHQIFDEKFDQEPKSVRVKMADLAGR